jgi:Fic family protein
MQGVRGQKKSPGLYRNDEVWIGKLGTGKADAKYIPPDATQVPTLMEKLISFLNDKNDLHALLICAVMHHRFEAIHPFKDGNGRVGRLLISFFLIKKRMLDLPMLYPSGYFEQNKKMYMKFLSDVDQNESWHEWFMFFLKALENQANLSLKIAFQIDNLFKKSRALIEKERANLNLIRVLEYTFIKPYITSAILEDQLGIPRTTCDRYLVKLKSKKIIEFAGVHKRNNVYVNKHLLLLLKNI